MQDWKGVSNLKIHIRGTYDAKVCFLQPPRTNCKYIIHTSSFVLVSGFRFFVTYGSWMSRSMNGISDDSQGVHAQTIVFLGQQGFRLLKGRKLWCPSSRTVLQRISLHRTRALSLILETFLIFVYPIPLFSTLFKWIFIVHTCDNNDTPVVRCSFKKDQRSWRQFQKVLEKDKVSPRVARTT